MRTMSDRLLKQILPDEKIHKVDLHEGICNVQCETNYLVHCLLKEIYGVAELDGNQAVLFYYVDPGHALERHVGKSKFRNKFYFQYDREESWTHPGMRAFGRVNGGLAFQGFQRLAGNAVPLCHVFYADKAGSTKHCTHFPIYGKNKVYYKFCLF